MEDDDTRISIVKNTLEHVEPLDERNVNIFSLLGRAERTADRIEDEEKRDRAYADIAVAYNSKGLVEEAWKVHHKIKDHYIKMNEVYPKLDALPGGRRYTVLLWALIIAAVIGFGWFIWWVLRGIV